MDATERYRRLALQCLSWAEGIRNPACRAEMLRLAECWAKLARRRELQAANALSNP